jgi:hypothetical protein
MHVHEGYASKIRFATMTTMALTCGWSMEGTQRPQGSAGEAWIALMANPYGRSRPDLILKPGQEWKPSRQYKKVGKCPAQLALRLLVC